MWFFGFKTSTERQLHELKSYCIDILFNAHFLIFELDLADVPSILQLKHILNKLF